MKHLLGIKSLSKAELLGYLATSNEFIEVSERDIKKVPALRGKTIINLFLEPSTRTRASFEIAGKRMSADTINLSGSASSVVKGETFVDTLETLQAMNPDAIVLRHARSGAPHFAAKFLKSTTVINAGDGMNEHPTQALLDCLTLKRYFEGVGRSFEGLNIAIVGDVVHSRVARSNIWAHKLLGSKIRLVGPRALVPRELAGEKCFGSNVEVYNSLAEGIEGADVVMVLRMQKERQNQNFVPSIDEYSKVFCVNEKIVDRYAPNSVVLHPGPANRGVEISGGLLDSERSLVRQQVNHGVAVRMAVLFNTCVGSEQSNEVGNNSQEAA
ncbi:MAG: aspartate carbamoyltransferase catalytic subunit [Bdellovibrionota bacterium]